MLAFLYYFLDFSVLVFCYLAIRLYGEAPDMVVFVGGLMVIIFEFDFAIYLSGYLTVIIVLS